MPIYERGSRFLVSVGSGKDRIRKAYKTYADAVLGEKQLELILSGVIEAPVGLIKPKSEPTCHTLQSAYDITLKDHWSQNRSNGSHRCAKYVLKALGGDMPLKDITTAVVRNMVSEFEDAGNSGSTVNGKISALSMMLKTAADEGWIETLPRLKRRTPGDHRIRWLDYDEEMEVLNTCTRFGLDDLRDFVVCAIDTGFRRMELLDFKVREYRGGMLNLHPDETKTAKARAVPATDRVDEIITRRRNREYLFEDLSPYMLWSQWEQVRAELGKAEDPQFVVHMLRHTCASRLAMQDKSAQFIQAWMGHATPLTTARYMHLAPGKLKEGKDALEQYRREHIPFLRTA